MTVPEEPRRLLEVASLRLEELQVSPGPQGAPDSVSSPIACCASRTRCATPCAPCHRPPLATPGTTPPLACRLQYLTPRGLGYGWLGEHQDEAAELAALLHEAAPKLALANLRPPGSAGLRAAAAALPRARSYEISDSTKDRLRAAVPLPTGVWHRDGCWCRHAARQQAGGRPAGARVPVPLPFAILPF